MKIKAVSLLLILIALIAIAFFSVRHRSTSKLAQIGSTVPDFELVDINNKRIGISDLRGSVVFVNFWATWCGSCVEELPSIERLHRNLSGDISFKMVTILYRDSAQQAFQDMRQSGYTFPVYVNPDESAAKIFSITGVPETFILDKKGIFREKVIGPAEWDSPQAIAAIQALMHEP